ncbi:hypothetical protein HELRODRAFT_84103 [Helobdella robusta]|uniref:Glycosyltransferase 2-like domain-containing protein n=1 Tax=Helobdella robusta TaxID=6412 RepID=T1G5E8_HELRO|nr:hypothetical protein HELRODRAFT_84103 [Helobdella robusta]ESN99606.1 hypothetical protein HELRODRAFT_84103 [Helobdella robusta]
MTCKNKTCHEIEVSVIIPVHNSEEWLDECLKSVLDQDFNGKIQVSIYDDCSIDKSWSKLKLWEREFLHNGLDVVLEKSIYNAALGVGYARNRAVKNSSGRFLCFLDSDDVMTADRIRVQHGRALQNLDAIIGSRFVRWPKDSTLRFTKWANNLEDSNQQLYTQAFTSHGPTLIMPTWFISRKTFDKVGGFDESGKGTPEDLIFFYQHLKLAGKLCRCPEVLLTYRYHKNCSTFSVSESVIWDLRVQFLQERIIRNWSSFTIWNAGKQGRKLYRSLSPLNQKKVIAFCDVDVKKINQGFYIYEHSTEIPKPKVPIIHFTEAQPPIIICVKLDLTDGEFEKNLELLHLQEGVDYIHFN